MTNDYCAGVDQRGYVSERDAILRERAAFERGARAAQTALPCAMITAAREAYPLPRVTRPRVVKDNIKGKTYRYFRVVDGQVQTRQDNYDALDAWHCLDNGSAHATVNGRGLRITPERIRLLADLLANPIETVEEDA